MITTTTATTAAISSGLIDSLALMAILFLVGMLITKEISSALPSDRAKRLHRALNVALIPLGVVFIATLAVRLLVVLS